MIKKLKAWWDALMHNEALKKKMYTIIFESDTPMGKLFDVALIIFIIFSVLLVFIESMEVPLSVKPWLMRAEYLFTIVFTAEYVLRLYCSPKPKDYALSFFGIIDLVATLPFYMTWIFGSARYLLILRVFRLIRVFRVFKLFNFLREGNLLLRSIILSSRKIFVFFLFVVIMVISLGTIMYMIEGDIPGTQFTNIPKSIYWAIVTMTTVGYGDVTPVTGLGRFLSSIVMLLGYTIMAVPTGIVSVSMMNVRDADKKEATQEEIDKEEAENERLLDRMKGEDQEILSEGEPSYCPYCGGSILYTEARFCPHCGRSLITE
ncbi:MAG: ion transporter [Bacteroidaceae bacterium]|nr:ion transporter [Bacteroidaceae bacterium]